MLIVDPLKKWLCKLVDWWSTSVIKQYDVDVAVDDDDDDDDDDDVC